MLLHLLPRVHKIRRRETLPYGRGLQLQVTNQAAQNASPKEYLNSGCLGVTQITFRADRRANRLNTTLHHELRTFCGELMRGIKRSVLVPPSRCELRGQIAFVFGKKSRMGGS